LDQYHSDQYRTALHLVQSALLRVRVGSLFSSGGNPEASNPPCPFVTQQIYQPGTKYAGEIVAFAAWVLVV
jgi:hypothetical protein